MAALRERGIELVVVSSGAIAEGMSRMRLTTRPSGLHELQALAAIGQMGLVQAWESCFQAHDTHTAQVLLSHDDFSDRGRYLNARSTLRTLVGYGVVPIINENDTVATSEIRLGDNDTLAGLTANLMEAHVLVLLTDQRGLYTADPRHSRDARLGGAERVQPGGVEGAVRGAPLEPQDVLGVGLERQVPGVEVGVDDGAEVGTTLLPGQLPVAARKRWLAGHPSVRGSLVLDEGAVGVLRGSGRSLLAVGVRDVHGSFARGEIVRCVDAQNREVARGLVNYSAEETRRIMGQPSERIESLLGYVDEPELIHRDNLVLMEQ